LSTSVVIIDVTTSVVKGFYEGRWGKLRRRVRW